MYDAEYQGDTLGQSSITADTADPDDYAEVQPQKACHSLVQGLTCRNQATCLLSHEQSDVDAALNAEAALAEPPKLEACRAFNFDGCPLPQWVPGLQREHCCAFDHKATRKNELIRRAPGGKPLCLNPLCGPMLPIRCWKKHQGYIAPHWNFIHDALQACDTQLP
jgi:hypothetical protein